MQAKGKRFMKIFLTLVLILSSLLMASDSDKERKSSTALEIKQEIKRTYNE
jgi:hypothetical protein